jgi:hypothetical protein
MLILMLRKIQGYGDHGSQHRQAGELAIAQVICKYSTAMQCQPNTASSLRAVQYAIYMYHK